MASFIHTYVNMRAIIFAISIGLVLIAGLFALKPASAEAAVLQCAYLSSNMSVGSRDASTSNQVSLLQRFLAQDPTVYPEAEITGYFGPQTQKALQRFQSRHGIVSSGTPATTGYGSVGARTRALISSLCERQEHAEEDDENGGLTIDDIEEIVVYINKDTDEADVEVIINQSPDLSFDLEYVSISKAVTFIGEKLENSYDFDFDEFSTDRKRDAKLKRLMDWQHEEEDEDEDTLTLSDIRKITVTSNSEGEYVDVDVDLKDSSDLSFDVVDESESKTATAIAEKLEKSYDFDFDEYTSDRKRDAQVKKLIDWIETDVDDDDDATLKIEASIYGGCDRTGACPNFNLNGKSFVYKVSNLRNCLSLDCQKPAVLTGKLSTALYDELVNSLSLSVLTANSQASAPSGCASHIDGSDYKYRVTKDGKTFTLDTCATVFGDNSALKSMLAKTWTEMQTGTAHSYTLADVKTVTTKTVDPIPNAIDDEYTLYIITLKDGTKHEVKVHGMRPADSIEKLFKDTGYTGSVEKLRALATADPSVPVSYDIDDVKKVTSKYVDPIPNAADDEYTIYTITLKNGTQHAVKVGFTTLEYRNKAFTNTGYAGDVNKLIALAKTEVSDATMCLSDKVWYKEGTEKTKIINADGTSQGIADGVFRCIKGKWSTKGLDWGKQPTTPFSITDVKGVVTKFVDPTPSNSYTTKSGDEYTQYTLKLKDGSERSVNVDFGSYSGVVDQFEKIGFTGSVWDVTIMAAKGAVQGASTTNMIELLSSLKIKLEELKTVISQ